jgi:hypothetical protein
MTDRELIESMGGPTKVAERLGFKKRGGVQRVQNWLTRGIPAAVKVAFPELFLGAAQTARPPRLRGSNASPSAKRRATKAAQPAATGV